MGSSNFYCFGKGKTRKEAFKFLVQESREEEGCGGYTGTIAEKHDFVSVGEAKDRNAAVEMANQMIDAEDKRIDDKWGPAGCISIMNEPNCWLFFGWASS